MLFGRAFCENPFKSVMNTRTKAFKPEPSANAQRVRAFIFRSSSILARCNSPQLPEHLCKIRAVIKTNPHGNLRHR